MSRNAAYLAWANNHLLISERLNASHRSIQNFVFKGYLCTDGGGLILDVGTSGVKSYAYIDGFEVEITGELNITLDASTTQDVYLAFIFTTDLVSDSVATITPVLEKTDTTAAPANAHYLKLARVVTHASGIVSITTEWSSYVNIPSRLFNRERFPVYGWVIPTNGLGADVALGLSSGATPFYFYEARFDKDTSEYLYIPFDVPFGFSAEQPPGFPRLRIIWKANSTDSAKGVRFEVGVSAVTPVDDVTNFNVKSLDSWNGASTSQLGTIARRPNRTFIELINVDGWVAEDVAIIGLRRNVGHVDDILPVDAEVTHIAIEYAVDGNG